MCTFHNNMIKEPGNTMFKVILVDVSNGAKEFYQSLSEINRT